MAVANANPGADTAAEAIHDGDNTFVRVGAEARFGHGARLGKRIAVEPGTLCEIGWRARIPDGDVLITVRNASAEAVKASLLLDQVQRTPHRIDDHSCRRLRPGQSVAEPDARHGHPHEYRVG